jgi:hypothetical protein
MKGKIMAKKNPMDIKKLVSWITKTRKRQIEESCGCGKIKILNTLKKDPDQEIHSIYSNISNWKNRARGENGREIEDLDSNEDLKVSQDVVCSLQRIFKTEIDALED